MHQRQQQGNQQQEQEQGHRPQQQGEQDARKSSYRLSGILSLTSRGYGDRYGRTRRGESNNRSLWSASLIGAVVVRKYPITRPQARMNIHDATHPTPISRARRGPRQYDVEIVESGTRQISVAGRARPVLAPYEDATCCNGPPRSLRIDRRCASEIGISQSRHSRRIVPINAFADRVRHRAARRRLQHPQPEPFDGFIQALREDAVPIVDQIAVGSLETDRLPQLL